MAQLEETLAQIRPLDREAMAIARHHQNNLAKPLDSLGRLEEIAVQLAGIGEDAFYKIDGKAVIVAAADHGVLEEEGYVYPQEVTTQMMVNLLGGGSAVNVLARQIGSRVIAVDVGLVAELVGLPNLVRKRVRSSTNNITVGPAMTIEEARQSIENGISVVREEIERGADIIAVGEIGTGNMVSGLAILESFIEGFIGKIDDKTDGVSSETDWSLHHAQLAVKKNAPNGQDTLDVLAKVGGVEIGMIAGIILGAAALRRPVVLDGLITGVAALIASGLSETSVDYLFASHSSSEDSHESLLRHLGLNPLLNLKIRLGQGTGAVLGMSVIEAAARCQIEMTTFDQAGVAGPIE
ncbi:nicotinate-nucleotide--dimethylbenzimidazole phosphoribosyltransferase [Dehalococcoidia bacterium]|nr:nicotinate-nucleotide--dimethylbenzimidazole phosphoribosyltransferase [Dehalococcoidia bacterium]